MTTLHYRGRCRLMLRIPAWRTEFREASGPDFLDVCEAYELAWRCLMVARESDGGEYGEAANWLEIEALSLALWTGSRRAI